MVSGWPGWSVGGTIDCFVSSWNIWNVEGIAIEFWNKHPCFPVEKSWWFYGYRDFSSCATMRFIIVFFIKLLKAIDWIAMKLGKNIFVHFRMKCNKFYDFWIFISGLYFQFIHYFVYNQVLAKLVSFPSASALLSVWHVLANVSVLTCQTVMVNKLNFIVAWYWMVSIVTVCIIC